MSDQLVGQENGSKEENAGIARFLEEFAQATLILNRLLTSSTLRNNVYWELFIDESLSFSFINSRNKYFTALSN